MAGTSLSRTPRLFERYVARAAEIPWLALGTRVTPVEPIRLAGIARADTWVKRDDLTSDLYGGNKVRKLEFLLADARRRGARRVLTVGSTGSHHAMATAIYATRLGFDVSLVLFPEPVTPAVRQALLIDHAVGAELRFTRRMETVPLAVAAARLAYRGAGLHVIPPGGSCCVGALGYVDAALELAEQVEARECPAPEVVYVAGGTLGTAAGLALGFALAGLPTRVRAVRVTSSLVSNERVLRKLIEETATVLVRAGVPVPSPFAVLSRIELLHDFIGSGYGSPTEAGRAAVAAFAEAGQELRLEHTYTAKAAAAFLEAARAGARGPLLFWHTISATVPTHLAAGTDASSLPEPFRRYLECATDHPSEEAIET